MSEIELCHCGQLLHYNDKKLEWLVRSLIKEVGSEFVTVIVKGRSWRVQRHYIALHGLTGKDVANLGFEEII